MNLKEMLENIEAQIKTEITNLKIITEKLEGEYWDDNKNRWKYIKSNRCR